MNLKCFQFQVHIPLNKLWVQQAWFENELSHIPQLGSGHSQILSQHLFSPYKMEKLVQSCFKD